jgi:hypothetical protein
MAEESEGAAGDWRWGNERGFIRCCGSRKSYILLPRGFWWLNKYIQNGKRIIKEVENNLSLKAKLRGSIQPGPTKAYVVYSREKEEDYTAFSVQRDALIERT